MEYDGKERLIQRARLEGWTDAQARENGPQNPKTPSYSERLHLPPYFKW